MEPILYSVQVKGVPPGCTSPVWLEIFCSPDGNAARGAMDHTKGFAQHARLMERRAGKEQEALLPPYSDGSYKVWAGGKLIEERLPRIFCTTPDSGPVEVLRAPQASVPVSRDPETAENAPSSPPEDPKTHWGEPIGPEISAEALKPIKKAWEFGEGGEEITLQGRKYNIEAAIFAARDLPVFEMRIDQMYLSYCAPSKDTLMSFCQHVRMVNEADLSFPILLNENGAIINGKHRLAKTVVLGLPTIKYQKFETDPTSCYTEE